MPSTITALVGAFLLAATPAASAFVVTKTPVPRRLPADGQIHDVSFVVTVECPGQDGPDCNLNELFEFTSRIGLEDLNGVGSCRSGIVIEAGSTFRCRFTRGVESPVGAGPSAIDSVTALGTRGLTEVFGEADATVEFFTPRQNDDEQYTGDAEDEGRESDEGPGGGGGGPGGDRDDEGDGGPGGAEGPEGGGGPGGDRDDEGDGGPGGAD